jgi:two-component system chemotaxis sensor kinase CheA
LPLRPPLPENRPIGEEPNRTVRVKAELLDQLLEGVSELLLSTARVRELGRMGPENLRAPLESEVDQLHGRVKDLHAKVMKARMTPIAVLTDRLPRVVRDIARRRERDVELSITGSETELDRAIVDELTDPLTHILRNAIDHGIEPSAERERMRKPPKGRVQVSVRREKERVVLEIDDDGRGIDGDKLKAKAVTRGFLTQEEAEALSPSETLLLCCLPGVSTAADVTDISGRGVGMDAVKRTIESVGGTLEIESQVGHGTRFRLLLPLTVAVVPLLLVEVGDEMLGIPVAKVMGVVEVPETSLSQSQEASLLSFAKTWVPVYSLGQLLALPSRTTQQALRPYVVVEGDRGKVALEVDRLRGQEEAVLKALYRPLDLVSGLSGVTILGNGRPIFILDVQRLIPR